LGNVALAGGKAQWLGDALDRSMPIVQWLPAHAARPFTVLKPQFEADAAAPAQGDEDADDPVPGAPAEIEVPPLLEVAGLVESAALGKLGEVVQFERFGFVRLETQQRGVWLHQ
ncbi:MAG TPA: hypothetical protein VM241_06520, partial [Candidatus Thermoplasmatota archaeon]|nr:hypothetical protein [Candidatus Thermoplasmatota archaeon]